MSASDMTRHDINDMTRVSCNNPNSVSVFFYKILYCTITTTTTITRIIIIIIQYTYPKSSAFPWENKMVTAALGRSMKKAGIPLPLAVVNQKCREGCKYVGGGG